MSLVNVKGSFDKFQGVVTLDEKNLSKSSIEVTVETASINTGVEKRDEHLRTDDFFDCPKYPTIRFCLKKSYSGRKTKTQGNRRLDYAGSDQRSGAAGGRSYPGD